MISLKLVEMRWLCIMFAIMLNISSNAQAVIESIPAETKWCLNNSYVAQDCSYPTDLAAAQATVVSFQSPGVWVITGCSGIGSCDATYSLNGFVVGVYSQWIFQQMSTCPVPATYSGTPYQLDPASRMCSRVIPCPPRDVIDPATGQCVHCPIDPIPDFPKDDKDYACTQSLDKGAGVDVDKVCPPINAKLTAWNGEMQCFEKKLAALHPPIPYSGPSATIRTKEYQQHLLEIWKQSEKIVDLSDAEKQACASRIADVNAQMGSHKIKYGPSSKGSAAPHVQGIAFDIPEGVVNSLMERVTMTQVRASISANHPGCISCMHIPMVTGDVQDYINSSAINPPACKLDWGGRLFINPKTKKADTVHFQLQPQLP